MKNSGCVRLESPTKCFEEEEEKITRVQCKVQL